MDFFKYCISEIRMTFKRNFRPLSTKIRIFKKINFYANLGRWTKKKKLKGQFMFDHRCTIFIKHTKSQFRKLLVKKWHQYKQFYIFYNKMSIFHQIKLRMFTHNLYIYLVMLLKFGFKIHSRIGDIVLFFKKKGSKKHIFGKNLKNIFNYSWVVSYILIECNCWPLYQKPVK